MRSTHIIPLLKKYDVPGPRYTSYPTVPAWTENVTAADAAQSLQSLQKGDDLSLYFHLPFCENLCHFCGCMQVITKDHSRSRGYVDTVLKELKLLDSLIPKGARSVTQLHFGGGTPNFLQPQELTEIMEGVRKHFNLLPHAEIAIEMHPRTSTKAFCENLKELGFNRISLGVQDLDPKVQKLINRNQTFEMTRQMVDTLRALGFENFNFDLVYGLPGQSEQGWLKTLDQVLGLDPDRLAVYSYAHVPWVRPVQRTFADSDLPSPEMKLNFFGQALEFFLKNGYSLIGMDHFAKETDELSLALKNGTLHRNFMGYTTQAEAHQIGLGVSAISYVGGNYFQNEKKLKFYTQKIEEGSLATHRGYLLSKDDAIRRDLISLIMCQTRFKVSDFEKKWNLNFNSYFPESIKALQNFVGDGLLFWDGKEFKVMGEGFLFLRNMAMAFDPYLEDIQKKSINPTFSRTV